MRGYTSASTPPASPAACPTRVGSILAMSVTTATESATCTYTECDREDRRSAGPPGYCSDACFVRQRGRNLINRIESDHHYCSTCYGRVKTTEPVKAVNVRGPDHPGREDAGPKNVADAYQHPTDRTTWGVDTFGAASGAVLEPGERAYREVEGTRWSCICGAVNPNDTHGIVQALFYHEAKVNLFNALVDAYRRGAIDPAPTNQDAYLDAFRAPWRGAEYAVGVAVSDP